MFVDAFEAFFVLMMSWISAFSANYALLAEVILDGEPQLPQLLLKLHISSLPAAPLLLSQIYEWHASLGDQFGPKLRADPRLHCLGYVRDFLFAGSSSAPAVSSLSASLSAAVSPPLLPADKSVGGPKEEVARPPTAWRPAESSAPASAAAHVKGEKECAVTPLFLLVA